jgi:predicted transcriptional regulator
MDPKPPLGDQQLEVFNYVAEHAPITLNEVAKQYGEPRGLARTTVLTVMEKLRAKGYLARTKQEGVYRYSPSVNPEEVKKGLIGRFIEKALGGSIIPFIAYLGEKSDFTEEEITALRKRLEELESEE